MKRWFSFVALLALTSQAIAQEHTLKGVGGQSCGEFASQYSQNPSIEDVFFTWALGFMSGMNLGSVAAGKNAKALDSIPATDLKKIVRDYCNSYPLASYYSGIIKLWGQLPNSKYPMGPVQHQ